MSNSITENFKQEFFNGMHVLSQQKGSRLAMAVRNEKISGESAFFDRLADSAATKKTTRHGNTPNTEIEHSRRMVVPTDYEWSPLISKSDRYKLSTQPDSFYMQSGIWAMGKARDDEIISAFFGNAYSGPKGLTAVPFPAGNIVPHDSAGLTVAKLILVGQMFDMADVDPDEPKFFAYNGKQKANLLNTTEVKSSDYNSVKALVEGKVDTFMGFKFILTNRLNVNGSSHRMCAAWAKSGMLLGVGQDVEQRMSERDDKSYDLQLYMSQGLGATRMEEAKVYQVPCVET